MDYGYIRVSTKGQVDGNSIEDQTQLIKKQYPEAELIIESYSGAKKRPLFSALIEKCVEGDRLIVTKLDRFCRTTKEGLEYIYYLKEKGVKIHVLNMGLIENTPMGDLITTCLLAFAQFERAQIIERTQAGKAIAKTKEGFREGRPKKFTTIQLNHAMDLLQSDYSFKEVERMTGISVSTLIREKNKRKVEGTWEED